MMERREVIGGMLAALAAWFGEDGAEAPRRRTSGAGRARRSTRPSRLSGGGAASYASCSAARAAGAAPVRSGDPGYSRRLDRDGDGVGCE